MNLQGELATLERMLVELEAETATLKQEEELQVPTNPYAYELQQEHSSSYRHDESGELYAFNAHEDESGHEENGQRDASDEEYDIESDGAEDHEERDRQQWQTPRQREPESPGNNTSSVLEEDVKLSQVCYKSLSIGMHLAKKMDQVSSVRQ